MPALMLLCRGIDDIIVSVATVAQCRSRFFAIIVGGLLGLGVEIHLGLPGLCIQQLVAFVAFPIGSSLGVLCDFASIELALPPLGDFVLAAYLSCADASSER